MRDEFVRTLLDLARGDPKVMLITGDLGFGVLTCFAEALPEQFLNAGVAEQNMTGLAVGMALEGRIVFTYSIANFPTLRCLEQIRNDACYHDANVKIVAVGGGFAYGALGVSHHATEDLAIMRALPNMRVFAPGDPVETAAATRAAYQTPGTCYLRLGRGGEPLVHKSPISFAVGRALQIAAGRDIVVISTGAILSNAHEAVQRLAGAGLDIGLYSMPTIKPIDVDMLAAVSPSARLIVTVEEHSVIGGLGSAVAEVLAQMPGRRPALRIIGLQSGFSCAVGDQQYLRQLYGLSTEKIAETIKQSLPH